MKKTGENYELFTMGEEKATATGIERIPTTGHLGGHVRYGRKFFMEQIASEEGRSVTKELERAVDTHIQKAFESGVLKPEWKPVYEEIRRHNPNVIYLLDGEISLNNSSK